MNLTGAKPLSDNLTQQVKQSYASSTWFTMAPLFGGAITVELTRPWLDASTIRQVPDNQEVFIDAQSNQSLIIELLELTQDESEPTRTHFNELAKDHGLDPNDPNVCCIIRSQQLDTTDACPHLPADTSFVYVATGTQCVSKFNEAQRNVVAIIMAVVRLAAVDTDMVVSLNVPVLVSPTSSDTQAGESHVDEATLVVMEQEMRALLKSIEIKDWSLFPEAVAA